ncbi:PREDICTED: uncharacterized protein LOC107347815 [Acropora digitifera]|uniref:uncharacterized protein LOC107347815 n=1 Tax=Acropora digitifera TaxID=70779 RepID=UPI00077A7395|nr:PREDICTED: uncharacterized protein LOC107347815 [Acropora digitifera]
MFVAGIRLQWLRSLATCAPMILLRRQVKLGTSSAVTEKKGVKRGLEAIVPDVLQQYLHQFRVSDWVLLYFKLEARIPDEGWQTMINLTKLGRTGKNEDADILLNKNQIKAVRRMVFTVVKKTLGLHDTPKPLKGRQVELQNVLTWLIREQRLHGLDEEEVKINIKLDGRPFWGKRFECHSFPYFRKRSSHGGYCTN